MSGSYLTGDGAPDGGAPDRWAPDRWAPDGGMRGEVAGGGPAGDAPAGGAPPPGEDAEPARLTAWLAGHVQGVGLRWWIRARALELGLVGSAENLEDGRVKVVAEGAVARCRELLALGYSDALARRDEIEAFLGGDSAAYLPLFPADLLR